MLILLGYISIAIIVSVYCVISSAVKVKIGHPPVGLLFFAYKYLFSGGNRNFRFLKKSKISRRTHKLVKLCYFSEWNKKVEYAEGVILSENGHVPDTNIFKEAQSAGLSFFSTPEISHAIFLEFPMFLWFPLAKLLAVLICYPRIKTFSQNHNLCGYPVIEIYSKNSVIFIVPLEQQDCFVVQEAEPIMFGKTFSDVYENYSRALSKFLLKERQLYQNSYGEESKNVKSLKLNKRIMKG